MRKEAIEHIPRQDALQLIYSTLRHDLDTEYIPLADACGRVTAEDIVSKVDFPDMPCSRWDGISFNFDHYAASRGMVKGWINGVDYAFTNTGIAVPDSKFDTMVKIEDTVFSGDELEAIVQAEDVKKGQNIIPRCERMASGEVIVAGNTLIRPSHLNLIASGGNLSVPVYRKPLVALIPSGDELVPCASAPAKGRTIESNTFSMKAKVEHWGGRAIIYPIVKDELCALQCQLEEAAKAADLIVICGGSGRGRHDLLQKAILKIGTLHFSSVEHGPGKRTCFAQINGVPTLGLVGPPGGEEMTFDFYAVPTIRALLRQRHRETFVSAVLDSEAAPHARVNFYFIARLYHEDDGRLHCEILPHSNIDRSIADHNGYLYVSKNSSGYKKGELVRAELRIGYENV